jgi:L-ascorbate metabolism protein UlaG (beta-lactamase superfamily)
MKNIIVLLVAVAVASVSLVSAFSSVNNRMPRRALMTMSSGSFARFLESNTFIFQLGDVKIFSDPVMSQLDFGIPLVYKGNKKFIDENFELEDAAQTSDMVMISQSFDDHAHVPTLKRLAKMRPDMPYLVPPSAKATLISCGIPENMITTLLPGQRHEISKGDTKVEILATNGALLGPPWAQKENGYIMRSPLKAFPSVYYEPHCMFDELELKRIGNVDYVICPVISQKIGSYDLVAGGKKSIDLAKVLGAKYFIPMMNGGLTQEGVLSNVVQKEGTVESFIEMARTSMPNMKILDGSPGRMIELV